MAKCQVISKKKNIFTKKNLSLATYHLTLKKMRSNRIILIFVFFVIGYFLYFKDKKGPIGNFWHTITGVFDAQPFSKKEINPYKSPEPVSEATATKNENNDNEATATKRVGEEQSADNEAVATKTKEVSQKDEPSLLDKIKTTVFGNSPQQDDAVEDVVPNFILPAIKKGDDIVKHKNYILRYDDDKKCPVWVVEKLRGEYTKGRASRSQMIFVPDKKVKGNTALTSDYNGSGYDRGHMAPAGDYKCCEDLMNETFYLSNICPQNPDLNRYLWENLEARIRGWAVRDEELFVITGPVLKDGLPTIGRYNQVAVPEYFYKIVLFYQPNGASRAIAFLVPNQSLLGERITKFVVPIDEVERVTGLDFFAKLPKNVQDEVEATSDWKAWTKIQ